MRSFQFHLHSGGKSSEVQNVKNPCCANNNFKSKVYFVWNQQVSKFFSKDYNFILSRQINKSILVFHNIVNMANKKALIYC
jgi:hypothetical protein